MSDLMVVSPQALVAVGIGFDVRLLKRFINPKIDVRVSAIKRYSRSLGSFFSSPLASTN